MSMGIATGNSGTVFPWLLFCPVAGGVDGGGVVNGGGVEEGGGVVNGGGVVATDNDDTPELPE